jgi:deoxyadenosine/deoxycytidine kinase
MTTCVYFEGGIGAGKSTLCKILVERLNAAGISAEYIPEPVEEWEKVGILQEFYKDMYGKSYEFQTTTYITRILSIVKAIEKYATNGLPLPKMFIIERSVMSDRYFFAEGLFDAGLMHPEKYKLYCDYWNYLTPSIPFKDFMFVYLKPSIKECMRRVNIRNRNGEIVSEEYQTSLIAKHDKMFPDKEGYTLMPSCPDKKYIRIETDGDFVNNKHIQDEIFTRIHRIGADRDQGCTLDP